MIILFSYRYHRFPQIKLITEEKSVRSVRFVGDSPFYFFTFLLFTLPSPLGQTSSVSLANLLAAPGNQPAIFSD